jgi:hypothetical protein
LIAGDDVFLNNCVSDNLDYVKINTDAVVVFSRMFLMNCGHISEGGYPLDWQVDFFSLDAVSQYKLLAVKNNIWLTPSAFLRRILNGKAIKFDERYPFVEDYPLWLKLTKSGHRMHYLNKPTVIYRQDSSFTRANEKIWSIKFYDSVKKHFYEVRRFAIDDKYLIYCYIVFFIVQDFNIFIFKNKKTTLSNKINNLLIKILSGKVPI